MPNPEIWAHRGAPLGKGELPPENSLTAFHRALELGADALEFDLHLTRDNHLVIYHDCRLEHPRLGLTSLPDLTLEEVREVSLDDEGEPIPSFQDVLQEFDKDILLVPELKSPDAAKERGLDPAVRLLEVLEESDSLHRVIVQCFHQATLERLQELKPELKLLALYRHDQEIDFDSIPGDAAYLGIPMLKVFFFGESMVKTAQSQGRHIIPWREMTLSENPEVFERMKQFGVKALMVDDAEAALTYYDRCRKPGSSVRPHSKDEPALSRRCRKPS